MLFTILKYTHVLTAIVAVGFNSAYGLLIARARRGGTDGREMKFALTTIKLMDDRFANPCYGLLLVTGVGMVQVADYPWSARWIHGSLALLIVIAVIGLAFYTPTLRRQIEVLDARGISDPEFARLSKRGSILGAVLGVMVMAIVLLMVFKPM